MIIKTVLHSIRCLFSNTLAANQNFSLMPFVVFSNSYQKYEEVYNTHIKKVLLTNAETNKFIFKKMLEAYLEPCQTSKMEFHAKIINGFWKFNIFAKKFIVDVPQDSE